MQLLEEAGRVKVKLLFDTNHLVDEVIGDERFSQLSEELFHE